MSDVFESRIVIQSKNLPGEYTGYWLGSTGRLSETFDLTLPLNRKAMVDLCWYLEEYLKFHGAGDRARARDIERRIVSWGEALYHSILGCTESTRACQLLREAVQAEGHALITLESEAPLVLAQPWEMMRNDSGPLSFQGVTIRRQIQPCRAIPTSIMGSPLRVLLVVSRPEGSAFIDSRNSTRAVLDALDLLDGNVQVVFCDPPTLGRLTDLLQDAHRVSAPYHIVHFDGHGYYDEEEGSGGLYFENDWGAIEFVNAGTLAMVIGQFDVPLVLLEACRGARMSEHPVTGSLAPALLECGVGSVVAFSHNVHVEAARILVARFYGELARGTRVGQALEAARHDLRTQSARWLRQGPSVDNLELEDWFIPQLYQAGPDATLMSAVGTPTKVIRKNKGDALDGFPGEPMYRFHGRAAELLRMERVYRKCPAVVITGMGGMGKTALVREAAAWWKRTGRITDAVFCSFEQKAGVERVIQWMGEALEGPDFTRKTPEEQHAAAVESFHRQKVLVIWDNFESTLAQYQAGEEDPMTFREEDRTELVALYRDLVKGNPEGRLLVTCRPEETGLPGIKEVALEGLARPDSLYLLASVLDAKGIDTERPGYDRHAIDELLQVLRDHPLSVELVAPHLQDLTPETIRRDFGVLVQRFESAGADQERNKSLLASFEFSSQRLTQEAQALLPFLGLFEGGVFEHRLAKVAGIKLETWHAVGEEFMSLALVKAKKMELFTHRYTILHPTIQMLSCPEIALNDPEVKPRYVQCYLALAKEVRQAFKGKRSSTGMTLAKLEEANLWRAVRYAFECGQSIEGSAIGEIFQDFLNRSGRLREQRSLADWISTRDNTSNPYHNYHRAQLELAKTLSDRGEIEQAATIIANVEAQLERDSFSKNPMDIRQCAICYETLARRYMESGQFARALGLVNKSIPMFEQLEETEYMDLVAALTDRANLHLFLASYNMALADAERAREIIKNKSEENALARVEALLGDIMRHLNRLEESEVFYNNSLSASRKQSDFYGQAIILGKLGSLHSHMGRQDLAMVHLRESLHYYQKSGDHDGETRTCDLLGSVARRQGDFDVSEAWYEKSLALARRRKAKRQLATVTNNMGGLYLDKANLMPKGVERDDLLRKGLELVEEAMGLKQGMDGTSIASSHSTMGSILRELRDFTAAEYHLYSALRIHTGIGSSNVLRDYRNLEKLASARGRKLAQLIWRLKFVWAAAKFRVMTRPSTKLGD